MASLFLLILALFTFQLQISVLTSQTIPNQGIFLAFFFHLLSRAYKTLDVCLITI